MNLKLKATISDLLEGCQRGHAKSQELLYQALAPQMLGVCMRYAKDRYEAEDILQTGFVKVFQKIRDFRGEGSLEGWIRRIMVNTAIEMYRKNQRWLGIVDIDEVYEDPQTACNMDHLETKDLLTLIQELAGGYKLVFNMYVIEGYSHREIAETLGISEGSSKSQLSRARAILKSKLKKMEGESYAIHAG